MSRNLNDLHPYVKYLADRYSSITVSSKHPYRWYSVLHKWNNDKEGGDKLRLTFAGSIFFERMKERNLDTTDPEVLYERLI